MQYQHNNQNKITKRDRTPAQEYERLLMQYQGIFRHNITEYAEKVIKPTINRKNYSR